MGRVREIAAVRKIQQSYREWCRRGCPRITTVTVVVDGHSQQVVRKRSAKTGKLFQQIEALDIFPDILVVLDLAACQRARTTSKLWCRNVESLLDGQFRPFQRVLRDSSCPYPYAVLKRLQTRETTFMVHPIARPPHDIGPVNRQLYVNFLVDVQEKLLLESATLALAVNYTDRYMEATVVPISKLLCLGVTSLFMASKFQQVERINLLSFIEITDRTCTASDVHEMERLVMKKLDFQLAPPTAFNFLQQLSCLPFEDRVVIHFAQYLIELSYLARSALAYRPSEIAAAALFLSLEYLNRPFLSTLCKSRNLVGSILLHTPDDVQQCMGELTKLLMCVETSNCPAVTRKFSRDAFSSVATLFNLSA